MDGVLIDSTKVIWEAHNSILARDGIHITDEQIPGLMGRSLRDELKIIKKEYGLKKDYDLDKFSKESWKIQKKIFNETIDIENGPKKILMELKNKGFKLAVATSSSKLRALEILSMLNLNDILSVIVTADDAEKHKPDPELFLKAAEGLKVSPKDCAVVEDALDGIRAANSGGMFSIALLTKFHKESDFKEANRVIKNLEELKDLK